MGVWKDAFRALFYFSVLKIKGFVRSSRSFKVFASIMRIVAKREEIFELEP